MTVRKRHVAGGTFSVNLGRRKEREVEKVRGARREGCYIVYRCLQNAGYKASFFFIGNNDCPYVDSLRAIEVE